MALEDDAVDEATEPSSYLSKSQIWMTERNNSLTMTMFNFFPVIVPGAKCQSFNSVKNETTQL